MNTVTHSRTSSSALLPGLAVAVTVISWASAFPFIRIGLMGLPPLQLAAARFGTAAVLVVLWLVVRRPRVPSLADALRFLLCGALGIGLYNALLNTGEITVNAGAASFIVNTLPIFTALLAAIFLRERLNGLGWLGSVFSLGGVALIALGQPGGLDIGAGASLIFAAAFCCAIFFVLQRPLVSRYGALPSAAFTLLAGALCLSPWLPAAISSLSVASGKTVLAVGVLGVFPAAIGYATWSFALGHFGAARAANFLYLTPAVATLLSVTLTGERLDPLTLCGGLMVIGGVVFVNLLGRR
jgi:drug/metabolite transporter (DMT)-like permease